MLALRRVDPAREFQPFVLIKSGGGLLLGFLGGGGGLLLLGLPGGGNLGGGDFILFGADTGACEGRDT